MDSIEEQRNSSDGLQIPGLVQSQEAVEQVSFAFDPLTPMPFSGAETPGPASASIDGYRTPRPISQPGIAEAGPANSLSGLADLDTAHQPVVRNDVTHTQTVQPFSPAQSPTSSLSGLADLDTARQPISHAGIAEAERPLLANPALLGEPNSRPGLDSVMYPISQAGLLNTLPGQSNLGITSQPLSQVGLENPLPGQSSAGVTAQLVPQTGLEKAAHPVLFSPGTTRILPPLSQAGITQALGETRGAPNTTASRPPMVIRGSSQPNPYRRRTLRPPQGRRHVISLAGVGLLVLITIGTLLLASPIGQNVRMTLSGEPHKTNLIQNQSSNMSLVAQATATAVVHQQNDGYDPTSNGGPIQTGGPRSWPVGVCTFWANSRYHELTGTWVTWTGNAYQWADGARSAGWHVSTSPHVPSIIVLMPGVQGASGYGHVAVVEDANGDSVDTSNMNWYANGGGFDIVSHYTFHAGSGVYFIWA